jgi:WD40 repeat protein
VLVASFDRGGRIVDIDGGDSVRLLDESEPAIATGDFSPDGRQLVTVGGGEALVWDTATGREPAPLAGQAGAILRARFSWPDGRHIATVDSRGVVRLFDAKTHAEVSALPGGGPLRSALAFDSQSNAAVLIGAPGLELRRCEACQPAEWLMRNARLRVTRSPAEIERIERSPAVP